MGENSVSKTSGRCYLKKKNTCVKHIEHSLLRNKMAISILQFGFLSFKDVKASRRKKNLSIFCWENLFNRSCTFKQKG